MGVRNRTDRGEKKREGMGEEMMLVSARKHDKEVKELMDCIDHQKKEYEQKIKKLKEQLATKIEIEYKLRFPQNPHAIEVSKHVAETYMGNKVKKDNQLPFPNYYYQGLKVRVNEKLPKTEVRFIAKWVEPPIICEKCGKKKEYDYAYPQDNPKFCDKYCYENYFRRARK